MHLSIQSARSARVAAVASLILVLVAGCATREPAPVEERSAGPPPKSATPAPSPPPPPTAAEIATRPQSYTVRSGDTLHKIALDNGLDYRELAAWNNIDNPNVIRVGQVLRLAPPGDSGGPAGTTTASGVTTVPLRASPPIVAESKPGTAPPPAAAPVRPGDNLKTGPKALKEPYSERAMRDIAAASAAPAVPATAAADNQSPTPPPSRSEAKSEAPPPPVAADNGDDDRLDWMWPAKGKLIGAFSETANLKGIDIAGTAGEPVVASAPGKVVYAGTGLRGYGKLIIIKHNGIYLSAYAHNREILVKEGQQVARGQKIAEMGNTDADQVKLHFEIRRLGKPMDPVRYLPPA